MTDNVENLYGPNVEVPLVNADLVETLKLWLEMARCGELVAASLAGVINNFDLVNAADLGVRPYSTLLVAASARADKRLHAAWDNGATQVDIPPCVS